MTESALDTYPNISQSFKITGIVILGMVLLSPVKLVLNNLMGKEAAMLIYYLLAIGLPFWLVYSIIKNKTGAHAFNLTIENKQTIPLIIISTIVLHFGITGPLMDLLPAPESFEVSITEFVSQKGFFTFAAMVMVAPILEELIFRGIILDGLLKLYAPLKSILVSSFLFGVVHLNLYQLLSGFLFGIFSGWVYYRTRSLLPAIIIHAVANLGGFLMRYFINVASASNNTLIESYGGLTNLITALSGSIVIFLICVYYLKKEFMKVDIKNSNTPYWF